MKEARENEDPLHPALREFKYVVESDPALLQLANDIFIEVPKRPPYDEDPTGLRTMEGSDDLLKFLNLYMHKGPELYDGEGKPDTAMGLIGFPINAVLDWPMGTRPGYFFFQNAKVNAALETVLGAWASFLESSRSQYCVEGWVSDHAKELTAHKGNYAWPQVDGTPTNYTFEQMFVCDPSDTKHYGYGSWNAFFIRLFRDGVRPVEVPDDYPPDNDFPDPKMVIANACESAPLGVQTQVKWHDTFYLKDQPYCLGDMLNCNPRAHRFIGGTVYQAFLSALSYHRWHSPVNGTIVAIDHVPGTYYAENMYEGFAWNPDDPHQLPDPAAPNYSQPYISAIAARAVVYIQADEPRIGLMAVVFIGMAEVSSCKFTVSVYDKVKKGDELGMFHFGGSTHCLVFRPGLTLTFKHHPPPWNIDDEENLKMGAALGTLKHI